MTHAESNLLAHVAENAMRDRGFVFPPPEAVLAESALGTEPTGAAGGQSDAPAPRDLREAPFTSIDNPESRDLDQIELAERQGSGYRLSVGIADVDFYVPAGSATDRYAAQNATSVYTGVRTFPMLPDHLSSDLSSLVFDRPRRAIIIETIIGLDGSIGAASIYPALVRNRGKLDYPSVSAWLDGKAPPPGVLAYEPALRAQLELQDEIARVLAAARKRDGALDVDTGETRAQVDAAGRVTGLVAHTQDRAGAIIEELMIASNRAVARELDRAGLPSLRRVVKTPERWARIVEYAAAHGARLPAEPSSLELSRFADRMRSERPDEFPEISLSLVKLIGRGEYVAHTVGQPELGHFGLATTAYTHATAPNRRYPDLVTQRILKAMTRKLPSPISLEALSAIAAHCTTQMAAADKVERRVQKSAAAALLSGRIGEEFAAIVTGASDKGTYVRVSAPPVEGKLVRGERGLGVGDKLRVRLVNASVERGYIDFEALG